MEAKPTRYAARAAAIAASSVRGLMPETPPFRRVLVKLSGEALAAGYAGPLSLELPVLGSIDWAEGGRSLVFVRVDESHRPRTVLALAINYADHASESGFDAPKVLPPVFPKFISSLSGPVSTVALPEGGQTDWEVELGVVIGKPAASVTREAALDHVAGYCVVNDVSEREFQIERGGQWAKGKG